jgi:hypothetical protein
MTEGRFDRNERMFGAVGQARIVSTRIAVVGVGGLGSHVVQQAAYLGIGALVLVDADIVTESSLNRLVGARPVDVGSLKVEVAQRLVHEVAPAAQTLAVSEWLDTQIAVAAIQTADVVFGCLDTDRARLALTALTSAAGLPYLDLATEIGPSASWYGGRVLFAEPGVRCAYCLGELDPSELALAALSEAHRVARGGSYGVHDDSLDSSGASVVSLNGIVASLAMTELLVYLTGLRRPAITLTYRGDKGVVTRRTNEPTGPCPYCGRG